MDDATTTKPNRYGSRKFILAVGAVVSATWLVYTAHIADGVYSAIVLGAIAAYITGNVAQKATEKKSPIE